MKLKYRVIEKKGISDHKIFIIEKLIMGIFYWKTKGYYYNMKNAELACRNLNNKIPVDKKII